MASLVAPTTLLGTLPTSSAGARAAMALGAVVLGSLLLTVSAKISVPVWPVPVTLQTMAVAFLGAALGARLGAAAVALYLAQGLAGLPVFAGASAGPAYLLGPTGGFLLAWIPVAFLVGLAADRGLSRRFWPLLAVMVGANLLSFAAGFAWLLALSGSAGWIDQSNVVGSAFAAAVQPFIVWDLLKMALAALTISGLWAALGRKSET